MFIREHNGYKYRIETADNDRTVIAESSFAGKPVKGIAKCDPKDTPDLEKGIKLAILRCDEKIAIKKMARGAQKLRDAEVQFEDSRKNLDDMQDYFNAAEKKLIDTSKELEDYMDTL